MDYEEAEKIVDAIIYDLTDRRGLRHEWQQIDDETQAEIRGVWIAIVMTLSNTGTEQEASDE